MKYALIISASIILPIYLGLLLVNSIPLQIDKNIQLSENVGVTDDIKVQKSHTITLTLKPKTYCSSSKEGYMKPIRCSV